MPDVQYAGGTVCRRYSMPDDKHTVGRLYNMVDILNGCIVAVLKICRSRCTVPVYSKYAELVEYPAHFSAHRLRHNFRHWFSSCRSNIFYTYWSINGHQEVAGTMPYQLHWINWQIFKYFLHIEIQMDTEIDVTLIPRCWIMVSRNNAKMISWCRIVV